MNKEDIEVFTYKLEQAKRLKLRKFNWNGGFITIDVANKMLKKQKDK